MGDTPGEDFSAWGIIKEGRRVLAEEPQGGNKESAAIPFQFPAGSQRDGAVPLAQLTAARSGNQGEVKIGGESKAEKIVDKDLSRG